jgi:uncharacterized membrane protein
LYCSRCGTTLDENAQFCHSCGLTTAPDLSAGALIPPQAIAYVPPVGAKARTGEWVSGAWNLVIADGLMYALMYLIVFVVSGTVPLILVGPMAAGFHLAFVKRLLGHKPDVGDLFLGFNFFVPTLVAGILITIFTGVAFLFCLIPGVVVGAMYMFSYLFIVDKRMDFWPAMQASHAVVKQDYFGFTMFFLALIGVNVLGFLCCLVGLFVTAPMTYAAITIAYRDLVGFSPGVELARPLGS